MSKSVRAALDTALASGNAVRVLRKKLPGHADALDGTVRAVGPKWFILEVDDDGVYFDGWQALRIKDVSRVKEMSQADQDYRSVAKRALPTRSPVPANFVAAAAKTGTSALSDLMSSGPMVSLRIAEDDAGMTFIGHFTGSWTNKFAFHQIDPQGRWDAESIAFKFSEVTRVGIGGRYLDALAQFGNPRAPLDEELDDEDTAGE